MAVRLTVGLGAAAKTMPAHDAGEAAALGDRRHVDEIAGLKQVRADALAHRDLADVIDLELAQVTHVLQALQVAALRLIEPLDLPKPELHGLIAVVLDRLNLRDQARPCFDNRDGGDGAVVLEALEHAELAAQQSVN